MGYLYLLVSIVAEVVATTALKATDGFTRLAPSLVVVAGYGVAFLFLSLTLRTVPVGVAYAIWSGLGIVLVSLLAWRIHGQTLDAPVIVGMGLILAGVLVMNLSSRATPH